MIIEQLIYSSQGAWVKNFNASKTLVSPLVLVFADRFLLEKSDFLNETLAFHPDGSHVFVSTAGEIAGNQALENSAVVTAISFEHGRFEAVASNLKSTGNNLQLGKELASGLPLSDLTHVLLFSDGGIVNGSQLLEGFKSILPTGVSITGGMAGDGERLAKTLLGLNSAPRPGEVIAIGLYGNIQIGVSSCGGWRPFGPERIITRSEGNILYELDNQPALELYKKYLGPKSADLPASSLLFPLGIHVGNGSYLVRTVVGLQTENNGMVFAGDIPKNAKASLMRANSDSIIDGAAIAAEGSINGFKGEGGGLALLISCFGRKSILKHRVEEELEESVNSIGENFCYAGFYSNGEIAPHAGLCTGGELHNQTMTITLINENG